MKQEICDHIVERTKDKRRTSPQIALSSIESQYNTMKRVDDFVSRVNLSVKPFPSNMKASL